MGSVTDTNLDLRTRVKTLDLERSLAFDCYKTIFLVFVPLIINVFSILPFYYNKCPIRRLELRFCAVSHSLKFLTWSKMLLFLVELDHTENVSDNFLALPYLIFWQRGLGAQCRCFHWSMHFEEDIFTNAQKCRFKIAAIKYVR